MIATLLADGEKPVIIVPDYVLVNVYQGWWKQDDWIVSRTQKPVYEYSFNGVPLAVLYTGESFYEHKLQDSHN